MTVKFMFASVMLIVIGVFIMQMFVTADQINKHAVELNTANYIAGNLIEDIKRRDEGVIEALAPFVNVQDRDEIAMTFIKYYDENGIPIQSGPQVDMYMLNIMLRPEKVYAGVIYYITVDAFIFLNDTEYKKLFSLNTAKYATEKWVI